MCEKILVDKHKQVRSIRQKEKLKQWVMERAVKVEVLGSSAVVKKFFFSLFYCLCIMD